MSNGMLLFFVCVAIEECKVKCYFYFISWCWAVLFAYQITYFTYLSIFSNYLFDFKSRHILGKPSGFNICNIKAYAKCAENLTVGCRLWLHGWLTCPERNVTQLQKPNTFPTMWKEIMDFTGSRWAQCSYNICILPTLFFQVRTSNEDGVLFLVVAFFKRWLCFRTDSNQSCGVLWYS